MRTLENERINMLNLEILKTYTGLDKFTTKYQESELNMNYRFKEIKIKTHRPSNFVKNELDQEMSFQMAPPETMNLKATLSLPTPDLTNSQLKDLRIEEKRNYELENCKLKSLDRNLSLTNAEAENVEPV